MLLLHMALLATILSRTRLYKNTFLSSTRQEDIRASEIGAGHSHLRSHTAVTRDRLKGLMPLDPTALLPCVEEQQMESAFHQ